MSKTALFVPEGRGDVVLGHPWGEYTFLDRDCDAICSAVNCGWSGPLHDALDAAKGVVPSVRGNLRVWVREK